MSCCYYFGCWSDAGHFLHRPGGGREYRAEVEEFGASPFGHTSYKWSLDGTLAPRTDGNRIVWAAQAKSEEEYFRLVYGTQECPQGQFLIHRLDNGYAAMAWWDRTQGDTRGGCNSVLLLQGSHEAPAMLAALHGHFPNVVENLARAGIDLVPVRPSTKRSSE
jgi:hypothetical protein